MTSTKSTLPHKTALTLGFLALTMAIVAAYRQPAAGYELSVYASTPATFWIGVIVALVVGLVVVAAAPDRGVLTNTGLGLVSGAVLSIVAIPALRGYEFYGGGDSLTHLGWARELNAGIISPFELLYPAIHLIVILMQQFAGIELTRGLVVLPTVIYPLVAVLFFGFCLRAVVNQGAPGRWAFTIGVLVALLFVPINAVSVHTVAHPSSQAILFVVLPLYLMFRHLTADARGFPLTTPFGSLFLLVTIGLVLLHPQESMSFLLILFGAIVAQGLARRIGSRHPMDAHQSVAAHAMVMGLVWFAWTITKERALMRVVFIIETIGQSDPVGGEAATRGTALGELGGSLPELFVKLFGVTLLFCVLAMLVFLVAYRGRFRKMVPTDPAVAYLTAGLFPLTAAFLVVLVASQGDHYFRFLGFMMVPVTLLGAIALTRFVGDADRTVGRGQVASVVIGLFVVLMAFQMLTVHAGPYMYQGSQHVPEQEIEGHGVSFDHHDGETPFLGIRAGNYRYVDAYFGSTTARESMAFPGYRDSVPEEVFNNNLTTHYDEDQYIALTDGHFVREVGLYNGLRFQRQGFERFEHEPGLNRVQDNGEYRLYRLDVEATGDVAGSSVEADVDEDVEPGADEDADTGPDEDADTGPDEDADPGGDEEAGDEDDEGVEADEDGGLGADEDEEDGEADAGAEGDEDADVGADEEEGEEGDEDTDPGTDEEDEEGGEDTDPGTDEEDEEGGEDTDPGTDEEDGEGSGDEEDADGDATEEEDDEEGDEGNDGGGGGVLG